MKNLGTEIKSVALTGLWTLLPILLFILLLLEIFQLLVALATPIADAIFPREITDKIEAEILVAVILLAACSLIIGVIAKSSTGVRLGQWLETKTIGRIPLYRAVKRLILGFSDADGKRAIIPGLLKSGEGELDLVYIIEDHENGKLTVMIPWAPAAFAGNIKIVDAEKVEAVNSNLGEYSMILSHWGIGMPEVLKRSTSEDA